MVQLESSAPYDGHVDEDAGEQEDEASLDEGLRKAVSGLVESVNATSRQFSEAAASFAQETARVMDEVAARVGRSAGESRDMAAIAGRSADEARRFSDRVEASIFAAQSQVRTEVEGMIAEARSQIDETVAEARRAADEAQQQSAEALERIEQLSLSNQSTLAAVETAAEAARMSAETIEQATAEARARVAAESTRMDEEAATRVEESLAAGQEAVAAAQSAAEEARAAAMEAMAHAAEARTPTEDPVMGLAARGLLDRLEADYQLLTELVQSLHARISGLAAPAAAPAPVSDVRTPVVEATLVDPWDAPQEPLPGASEAPGSPEMVTLTAPANPEAGATASPATAAAEVSDIEPARQWDTWGRPETGAAPVVNPALWAMPDGEASFVEDTPESATAEAPTWSPAAEISWASPAAAETQTEPEALSLPAGMETESAFPADAVSPWAPSPWPGVSAPVVTDEAPEAGGVPTPEMAGDEDADAGQAATPPLSGRIVLSVSPVPDFDRLLSLDGALCRLGCVRNVTLADYAKEEVTFRVELTDPVSVEAFTGELAATYNQSLVVSEFEAGHLRLEIIRTES